MGRIKNVNEMIKATLNEGSMADAGKNPLMVIAKQKFEEFDMNDKEMEEVKKMLNSMDMEEEGEESDLHKAMKNAKDKKAFIQVIKEYNK